MSNEITEINKGIGSLIGEKDDREANQLANKLYEASHFYAQCLGKRSLSKYNEVFHKDILTAANQVRFSKDPVRTVQFYIDKIEHTLEESGKTNYIEPESLKTSVSIAWRQITGLALPRVLIEDKNKAKAA